MTDRIARYCRGRRRGGRVLLAAAVAIASLRPAPASAQTTSGPPAAPPGATRTITFEEALALARQNSPALRAAAADTGAARASRLQARSVLLPSVDTLNSYVYTQSNGTDTGRFVGSNGTREYLDEIDVHHALGVAETAGYRSAAAGEAAARAQAEIATRGLRVTVAERYDAVVVAERKLATARQADTDARRFLTISQDRERGGEAAHADVIKAQIQVEQRGRDLQDAGLALQSSRDALAVLILPDFDTRFTVTDELETPAPLPAFDVVQTQAAHNNPAVAAAQAAARQAAQDVWVARGRILPSLAVDYLYGIDANTFAISTTGTRHLGYSIVASVNVPLWNWGASQSEIAAAHLRVRQAQSQLSFTQRQLLADLDSLYAEARVARAQLDSLERSVSLATESLRLATLRYQAGEATVLEVVDAQTTLIDARNARDDGRARYHLALASLQTLTGTF